MGFRMLSAATVASLSLLASCAGTTPQEQAAADGEVPYWILDGVRLARDTKASWQDGTMSSNRPSTPTSLVESSATLPERGVVVAGLTALGLSDVESNCMYDNLAANADATEAAVALLGALSSLDPTSASAPAVVTSMASLDEQTMNRVVFSVAPCLSPTSLTTILLTAQGAGSAAGLGAGAFSLASLGGANIDPAQLASLQAVLANVDVGALSSLVAGGLGPAATTQLEALIRNALTNDPNLARTIADPLLLLNLDKLDLSKVPPEQLPIIFIAIARGLTPAQQRQLQNMAQVTFDDINLQVDPEKLTSEEIGGLLLILAPLLASAVRDENSPPANWDPSQIYLPPGADLSGMNPLLFVDRESVIASFVKQGISADVGACFFDSLRGLQPATLAALFSSAGGDQAVSSLLLAALICVVRV